MSARPGARGLILAGAFLTAAGLLIATAALQPGSGRAEGAQAQQLAGGAVLLVGWLALAWGMHRFGRQSER